MKSKICLITGGNSGIGKAAAIQMVQKGYTVIIGCRNEEKALAAQNDIKNISNKSNIDVIKVDMSLQQSIKDAVYILSRKYENIDVIINNAADFDLSRKSAIYSQEGIETVWATNHIGPVVLNSMLIESLKKSEQGRIINIASQGLVLYPKLKINNEDPEFKKATYSVEKAYYQSKLAQVMYTYWLAEKLKDTDITVNCIRVTNVKIDICRYPNLSKIKKWMYSIKSKFSITPEKMAETYVLLATDEIFRCVTGKYFNEKNVEVKSSNYSYDKNEIEKLMNTTNKYIT